MKWKKEALLTKTSKECRKSIWKLVLFETFLLFTVQIKYIQIDLIIYCARSCWLPTEQSFSPSLLLGKANWFFRYLGSPVIQEMKDSSRLVYANDGTSIHLASSWFRNRFVIGNKLQYEVCLRLSQGSLLPLTKGPRERAFPPLASGCRDLQQPSCDKVKPVQEKPDRRME